MIELKPGVRVQGMRPEILLAIVIARDVYQAHGHACIVTSGIDGKHSRGSLHYKGLAIDLRTRNVREDDPSKIPLIERDLRHALGTDYDVVLENTHIHVEYDPKEPY